MNTKQKRWLRRVAKATQGMDRQERVMEVRALSLKLYSNVKWSTPEIVEVEKEAIMGVNYSNQSG
jgi:hypothetical protein